MSTHRKDKPSDVAEMSGTLKFKVVKWDHLFWSSKDLRVDNVK